MTGMLSVPVYNMRGEQTGEVSVDPSVFGGRVRPRLIKQAVVAYLDHQRQYSARTKGRADVQGSTRKLYRQKGTGNARAGMIRTPVRRGGGRAFSKRIPRAYVGLPKKIRRLARNSAILSKIQSSEVLILDDLRCSEPKTKPFAIMLRALGAADGCVLALHERDDNIYRSGRNIARAELRLVEDLTAYDVLLRKKLILTRPAFDRLTAPAAQSA